MKFKCLKCGHTKVVEVAESITRVTPINKIWESTLFEMDQVYYRANMRLMPHYECAQCTAKVKTVDGDIVSSPQELVEWCKQYVKQE